MKMGEKICTTSAETISSASNNREHHHDFRLDFHTHPNRPISLSEHPASNMTLPSLPIFARALEHAANDPSKVAIVDTDGRKITYGELMRDVEAFREEVLKKVGGDR